MLVEHRLHLGGVDVLASGDDHVLHPVHDVDEAVVIEETDVAGVEPSPRVDRVDGGSGLVPVAGHDVRTARADLAAHPRFAGAARDVENRQVAVERALARRPQFLKRELGLENRHERRGLGESVALGERYAPGVVGVEERLGNRRAADDEERHAGEVGRVEIRVLVHEQVHGGDAEHRRNTVALDRLQGGARVEVPVQDDLATLLQGYQGCDVEAPDVEQRRDDQCPVTGGK